MAARKTTRRQVISGEAATDSFYKSFAKAGGGEALLFVIAAGLANYGGNMRGSLFEQIGAIDAAAATTNTSPVPTVAIGGKKVNGQVSVEVSASSISAEDYVDYIWIKDATTGEVLSARSYRGTEGVPPMLSCLVERERRLTPCVHYKLSGVSRGQEFTA